MQTVKKNNNNKREDKQTLDIKEVPHEPYDPNQNQSFASRQSWTHVWMSGI